MDKYTISFQNQKVKLLAKDHDDAIRKALLKDTGKNKIIAILTGVLKDGEDAFDCELLYHVEYLKINGYFKGIDFTYMN